MLIAYKPNINIVITGHIDHGKSTLIGRLLLDTKSLPKDKINELANISKDLGKDIELAYFADQFQEERVQEKTIDTTQLVLKTKDKNFVIIDAPGHAELIKNMITGATQAQAAILLIDATAGIKEQTLSHTYIISMLGINDLIVVINKMDLVNYGKDRFNEIKFEF